MPARHHDAVHWFFAERGASPVNIHAKASPARTMSPAEWESRVDLAAVYRLVAHYGWDDVIYNQRRSIVRSRQVPTFFGS
jgi:hypothetical protein